MQPPAEPPGLAAPADKGSLPLALGGLAVALAAYLGHIRWEARTADAPGWMAAAAVGALALVASAGWVARTLPARIRQGALAGGTVAGLLVGVAGFGAAEWRGDPAFDYWVPLLVLVAGAALVGVPARAATPARVAAAAFIAPATVLMVGPALF